MNDNDASLANKQALKRFFDLTKKPLDTPESVAEFKEAFKDSLAKQRIRTLNVVLYKCDPKHAGNDEYAKAIVPELVSSKDINAGLKIRFINSVIYLKKWNIAVEMLEANPPSKVRTYIFNCIRKALNSGSINCARVMPRNGTVANRIRGYMKLTPTNWRKLLVPICANQVNVMMSLNKWDRIDYTTMPTFLLIENYNAFMRHDGERFTKYLNTNPSRSNFIMRHVNGRKTKQPDATLEEVLNESYIKSNRRPNEL